MQVNLVSTGCHGDSPGSSREVLLPDLIQFLDPSAAPRTRHAQDLEQREAKLRRKDAEDRAAVAHDAATLRPAEVAQRAERDMLPGSQAARREQLQSQSRDAAAHEQRGFRQALADAANRASGERGTAAARTTAEPTASAKADTSGSGPASAGTPAHPAGTEPSPATARPATAACAGNSTATGTAGGAPTTSHAVGARGLTPARQSAVPSLASLGAKVTGVTGVAAAMKAGAPPATGESRPSGVQVVAGTSARTGGAKAPAGQAARAAPEAESNNDANIERMLRLIHTRIGKDRSVATLRLDPPELGTIRLHMDLRNDQLSLQVETETGAAQRLLGEQLDTLRKNLEASGIHLERVEIRAPTASNATAEPNTSQHADVWPDWQEHSARQDPESAGGGSSWEAESPPAEPTGASIGEAGLEPAAESLVNVLA
jgi:flagellar hook-length control protein FliK